ncbi:hypothetical protein [Shewanella sp. S23-S33]
MVETIVENGPYQSSDAALYCLGHQSQCLKVLSTWPSLNLLREHQHFE